MASQIPSPFMIFIKHPLKIGLLIFIVSVSSAASGQFNYKPGRIITPLNDTIFGLINDGGEIRNAKFCLFKANKKARPKKYYPHEIKSFLLIGEKYYSAQLLIDNDKIIPCFVTVLLEGSVDLYHSRKVNETSYYLKTEEGELIGLSNKKIEIHQPLGSTSMYWQKVIIIEKAEFKDTLPYLFRKSNLIQENIPDLTYDDQSLLNITKTYIGLTCQKTNCITFEQDLKVFKPLYGFFTGVQFSSITFLNEQFNSEVTSAKAISYPIGAFFNSPLHIFSPRLSFQIELLTSKFTYHPTFTKISNDVAAINMNSHLIAMPLLIKYGWKINKFNPTLGFGKEMGFVFNSEYQYIRKTPIANIEDIYAGVDYLIHWQQKGSWFFDLGLSYKLHATYSLFTSIRFQRHYNLIIDDNTSNHKTFSKVEKNNLGIRYMTDLASIRIGLSF